MIKKILISLILLAVAVAGSAYYVSPTLKHQMIISTLVTAGSISPTLSESYNGAYQLDLDWTSSTGGAVSGTTNNINGYLLRVSFVPDSGGTQPSNLYDVTILDEDDIDLLNGAGSDLSNSTASTLAPQIAGDSLPFILGTVQLVVANAGNAKGGIVRLYFMEP